jgi:hypothetical protein
MKPKSSDFKEWVSIRYYCASFISCTEGIIIGKYMDHRQRLAVTEVWPVKHPLTTWTVEASLKRAMNHHLECIASYYQSKKMPYFIKPALILMAHNPSV